MAKRKIRTREIHSARPTIIGEGEETEYWYFKHLCSLTKTSSEVRRDNFGPNVLRAFERRIKAILDKNGSVVVVFDTDVMEHDMAKRRWMQALKKKYRDHNDVLICDSYPCIEYWFLLHYADTHKLYSAPRPSDKVVKDLRSYMPAYSKQGKSVENPKWVASLRADGQEQAARERAVKYAEDSEQYSESKSYTNLYKFFDKYPPKA